MAIKSCLECGFNYLEEFEEEHRKQHHPTQEALEQKAKQQEELTQKAMEFASMMPEILKELQKTFDSITKFHIHVGKWKIEYDSPPPTMACRASDYLKTYRVSPAIQKEDPSNDRPE